MFSGTEHVTIRWLTALILRLCKVGVKVVTMEEYFNIMGLRLAGFTLWFPRWFPGSQFLYFSKCFGAELLSFPAPVAAQIGSCVSPTMDFSQSDSWISGQSGSSRKNFDPEEFHTKSLAFTLVRFKWRRPSLLKMKKQNESCRRPHTTEKVELYKAALSIFVSAYKAKQPEVMFCCKHSQNQERVVKKKLSLLSFRSFLS